LRGYSFVRKPTDDILGMMKPEVMYIGRDSEHDAETLTRAVIEAYYHSPRVGFRGVRNPEGRKVPEYERDRSVAVAHMAISRFYHKVPEACRVVLRGDQLPGHAQPIDDDEFTAMMLAELRAHLRGASVVDTQALLRAHRRELWRFRRVALPIGLMMWTYSHAPDHAGRREHFDFVYPLSIGPQVSAAMLFETLPEGLQRAMQ
jgi:hypothetical protein